MENINKPAMLLAVLFIGLLGGCTDAGMGKLSAYGGTGKIQCYSGTLMIYDGESTGKIASSNRSDGYYFVDKATSKLVEVSGNCVIRYASY